MSSLLSALIGQRPEKLPVWFMRQAGRSLPEYKAARVGTTILEACLKPELAAEITLQPVRRHKVDAAIFFSDIMTPLVLAGVDVDIEPGIGPVIENPIRTAADVDRVVGHRIEDPSAISEAVRLVVAELGESTPLIGFAGAPFTLAAYLVEGRGSRDHLQARAMMHADPAAWHRLLDWAAELSGEFLNVQIDAGARAVQLFDSWAGSLSRADYTGKVQQHSARVMAAVEGRVPRIHFGVGTRHLLTDMAEIGVETLGVDYRTPLDEAAWLVPGVPLQGNIDPAMLAAGWDALEAHTRDVVERGRQAPAHVVNLGHGVPPTTDPEVLTDLVALIHEL
ncbi:uroporphyrinogen decarboxylase [Tessaracoccus sp. MC1865]|uniref:uroporphyrinogen decarboxylase n=1 Tax=unclassified Tessaracoccus TaxID=2635419 RepID=UPI0016048E1F|nr:MULTISPECIES: uroporphyrinogen decarboxylase [unclassified Tessaracoccus]MBB1484822.1 uroporphyrinogen decarboxylase [Tessaracoccus sp. MC1865]MBB1510146.1 uroporphyrinogen decarboxylase [Tessaracoccus sp. MC1756]QTO38776.1 uroporphyrinogen decarboxylase [Tessaracoccus sp. MC1865]